MPDLLAQAQRLEALLPILMRGLALPIDEDPLAELTPSQLRFVRAIEPMDVPLSEVAGALRMSLSAATQLCQRLEESRIVVRRCDEDDRRVRMVGLSQDGRERLQKRRSLRVQRARDLLDSLPLDSRANALAALEQLADSVDPGGLGLRAEALI